MPPIETLGDSQQPPAIWWEAVFCHVLVWGPNQKKGHLDRLYTTLTDVAHFSIMGLSRSRPVPNSATFATADDFPISTHGVVPQVTT
jgi:hypothetical protein